jgi:hypothetical protein
MPKLLPVSWRRRIEGSIQMGVRVVHGVALSLLAVVAVGRQAQTTLHQFWGRTGGGDEPGIQFRQWQTDNVVRVGLNYKFY